MAKHKKPHGHASPHAPALAALQALGVGPQGPAPPPVDPTVGLKDALKIREIMALAQQAAVAGTGG